MSLSSPHLLSGIILLKTVEGEVNLSIQIPYIWDKFEKKKTKRYIKNPKQMKSEFVSLLGFSFTDSLLNQVG